MSGLFGVDGCSSGWIAATRHESNAITLRRIESLGELEDAQVIAIDIPIGLVDAGRRDCDQLARRALGRRSSCVFTAPIRPLLEATTYRDACAVGRATAGNDGKALSKQAWNIIPKTRDVDREVRSSPRLRSSVVEVHPEVIFLELSGGAALPPKRLLAGRETRITLLEPQFGFTVRAAMARRRDLHCEADDILDAVAALWTAERIARGTAQSMPESPPTDRFGLPMRIVF
jgi:predicted RNase H-like nuclease